MSADAAVTAPIRMERKQSFHILAGACAAGISAGVSCDVKSSSVETLGGSAIEFCFSSRSAIGDKPHMSRILPAFDWSAMRITFRRLLRPELPIGLTPDAPVTRHLIRR